MQIVSHSPEGAEQTHIQPLQGCHYPLSLPPPAAPAVIQIKVLRTFSTHHQCNFVNNHITNNPISYSGALHLKTQYFSLMLSILRHAVACLSVFHYSTIPFFHHSNTNDRKVQRTGMFVANKPTTLLIAAAQRNIIIPGKIQLPIIPFLVPVRCTSKSFHAR
jgi:hypothetical protein